LRRITREPRPAPACADAQTKGKGDQERRKGIPWTEDEHRLFLLGLQKYGKGDWRSISRNFVISRTPTQARAGHHPPLHVTSIKFVFT